MARRGCNSPDPDRRVPKGLARMHSRLADSYLCLERMMEDADIFHTAVAGYGGRLDRESLHPQQAARLDKHAGRAQGFLQTAATALPDLPPIYFDFIDTWKFNAIAFQRDGRYFIGVTRGALATLGVLFDRMLADPQFLPSIGDPNEEGADLPLLPNLGPGQRGWIHIPLSSVANRTSSPSSGQVSAMLREFSPR
jgi:hypothetical protein